MPDFIPGLQLSGLFFHEAVKPFLDARFPALRYSAALLGAGSEVLGFDTPMSTDHGWGPRLMLFLSEDDHAAYSESISHMLRDHLPHNFRGYPTSFTPPDPADNGTQLLQNTDSGLVNHRVNVLTLRGFVRALLAFDITQTTEPADWLTFPQQTLRSLTAGAVYHDDIGLQSVRNSFAYYPRDVWLYLLAAGWMRISQEEHLMGRAGFVEDEIGSALIAARLVRDIMTLCFMMEKQYAPYPKWFGTAFMKLACSPALAPVLRQAQTAERWQAREELLATAYETIATMHNALGITEPLPARVSNFHNRPFRVIHGERFADALCARITDPAVQRIATRPLIGGIDQFSDSTDLRSDPRWRAGLKTLYTGE